MRPTTHVPVVSAAKRDGRWRALMAEHAAAVAGYAAEAEGVSPGAWARRVPADSWSPGEITTHLFLSSEAALRELAGGPPMAPRLAWWMRPLVRWTILPRILRGGAFPGGVRAPRETRPGDRLLDRDAAIALFRQRADELERALDAARTRGARAGLTHPHFGRIGLEQSLALLAAHVRHHHAQLRRARGLPGAPESAPRPL